MTTSDARGWVAAKLDKALLTPIRALRLRYVPLLLIYFAYGLSGFGTVALSFWEKEQLGLSAEELVSITVWAFLPWTLKMVAGQFVDSVPILGSRRKGYVYLGAVFLVLGIVSLAGLAGRYDWIMWLGDEYTIYLAASVLIALGFVVQDVTADTMSTEVVERYEVAWASRSASKTPLAPLIRGERRPEEDIQADLAMVQVLGRLALSLALVSVVGLGGYLAQRIPYEMIFWLLLVIPVISCAGAALVRLEPVPEQEVKPLNRWILIGGAAFGLFSIGMMFWGVAYSQEIVFGVSLLLLAAMLRLIVKNVPAHTVKLLVFTLIALFLYRSTPKVGPGLEWWFIDELGFDQTFFGMLEQIGAVFSLLVLWFFADFIARKPVRSVLLFLVFLQAAMALPELLLYYDVHTMLGLEARTVALFNTAVDDPLVHVGMVPMLALIAYYAPAGYRGTWFAVAASLMNLALSGGRLVTKYLNEYFVITREVRDEAGEILIPADYSALGDLMIVKLVIAFGVPLLGILIFLRKTPSVSETEALEQAVARDLPEEGPVPAQSEMDT